MKKEKEFQAVLIQQCKEAEAFSAEEYVNNRLATLKDIMSSTDMKGQTLVEFLAKRNKNMSSNK